MADVANIKQVREALDHPDRKLSLGDFKNEWGALDEQDKAEFKQGIGDGSMNYPDVSDERHEAASKRVDERQNSER